MAIATKQRACGSVPLVLSCEVTGLININGGHSEAYIRNAGLGSVPKIANVIYIFSCTYSGPSGQSLFYSGSLHHSLQVSMFYIIDCFSGMGVDFGAFSFKVAYGCSLGIEI